MLFSFIFCGFVFISVIPFDQFIKVHPFPGEVTLKDMHKIELTDMIFISLQIQFIK